MLKKVTVLLIIFTLVISFSMTAFASGATVSECNECDDCGGIVIENPANPPADGYSDSGNGHGPNNPIHVAGE